jgi:hypothetical protein
MAQKTTSSFEPDTLQNSTVAQDQADILNRAISLTDSLPNLQQIPLRYFSKTTAKADDLNRRLTQKTAKALHRLQKQEEKINSKLSKIDSVAAHNLFTSSRDSLSHLQDLVKGKVTGLASKIPAHPYIPYLDTLKNSLDFLNKYSGKLSQVKEMQEKLHSSLNSVQQLEGKLNQLQDAQAYIQQRKQLLEETLRGYDGVFKKNLGKIDKDLYYYKAQMQNYKELWEHPDKIETKALEALHKVPAFNGFMKEHSALASLFNVAGSQAGSMQENLQGLQTRSMIEQEIQQRLQEAGAGGREQVQQQMQQAQQQLQELKNKLPGGGSIADMPNFKPKELKSKTLFQRLEYGTNIQFGKASGWYPTTSDIAAQIGYKFSEKGSAGIGTSFKLGWGNIHKIHFTARGLGLRSYLDYKLKGAFYVNGGFEMNYNTTMPDIPALKNWNGWTRSALLGIEKKYKISNKVNGNMMLLFNFLYREQVPPTRSPLVFRVGYGF